jgi:hypothetical protein
MNVGEYYRSMSEQNRAGSQEGTYSIDGFE